MRAATTVLKALWRKSTIATQRDENRSGRLIIALIIALVLPCLMTGDKASSAMLRTRKIIFEIHVDEPKTGLVQQAQGELVGLAMVPLTRDRNKFIGEYRVPDTLRDTIRCRLQIQLDDPAQPLFRLQHEAKLDFTHTDSPDVIIKHYFRIFPLQIQAVQLDASGKANPAFPAVSFYRQIGDLRERILFSGIPASPFRSENGIVNTYLFSEPSILPEAAEIQIQGTVSVPGTFDNNAIATLKIPHVGASVKLVFYAWAAEIRKAVLKELQDAGIAKETATTISQVPIYGGGGGTFAAWKPLTFPYNWTTWSNYQIALNANFNLLEPRAGDSLMHEFTHETLYRMGWQPTTAPNEGHDIEGPASIETQAWEEGLCHFIGSHLLTRLVKRHTPIGYTMSEFWLDTPNDRVRERAWGLRNQPSLNSPAGTVMQNPGNWIEGVVTGSLLELYQELGYQPETIPEEVLKAFVTDLRGFCAAVPKARWTVEEFFRYRTQNARGRIPLFENRVIDQIALWYTLTPRTQVRDIDRLIPVTLNSTGTTTVMKGDIVNLRASARAFHRLVGKYRNYGGASLRARLYEGTRQLGNDVPLNQPTTVPNYSAAALLPATFNDPGAHRIHAEIWGNFVDGTMERLGLSDDIEITVEPPKVDAVAIAITPSAITLEPEAVTTFTVTVTGTSNTAVMIEATRNGLASEGGLLTQTGPQTWSYKAPSYEGTVLIKATSRADYKKSVTATVTVKASAATGLPYGAKVEQLPCVWATGSTCNNNKVTYPISRINNSAPLVVSLAIPPGLNADNLKDLPLLWNVEFSKMTTPKSDSQGIDSLNCPPKAEPASTGGGGVRMGPTKVAGNQAYYQSTLSSEDLENAQIKIWLEVSDNVARPPIYKWNYKRGDRWLIYSGGLPTCGPGGQTTITGGQTQPVQPTVTPAALAVKLTANKTALGFGEQAKVNAQIIGGVPPYKLYWQGEHMGDGESVIFTSSKAGSHRLTLNVTDAKGNGMAQGITFTVSGLEVILEKIAPSGNSVVFGSAASFAAKLRSGGQPVSGNYIYRWQPQPEVAFTPPESNQATATAIFLRPGKAALWVSVLENKEGRLVTVADSQPLELMVTPPAFEIVFDQAAPFIGQETRAKILLRQPIPPDRIAFRWELPPNAKLLGESQDAREIVFLPSNDLPLTMTVRASVPFHGDSLGEKSATLRARPYEVKAITVTQPPFSVAQNVELLASIKPETAKSPVRFVWDVTADSNNHIVGLNAGKTVTINRSAPGQCAIVLEAFDGNGFLIGRDTTSFQVTITQADLDRATKAKVAAQKVIEAKEIIRKGKLDEAITLVEDAVKLDPTNTEAALLSKKWQDERTRIQQHLAQLRVLWADSRFREAQQELMAAQNLHYVYPPVVEAASQFNEAWTKYLNEVKAELDAIELSNDAREYRKSLDLAPAMRVKWKLYEHDLTRLNTLEQEAKTREAEKDRQRAILKRGEAKLRQQDYAGAIADFEVTHAKGDFYQHWSIYQSEPHYYEKLRTEAHQKLARINQLLESIRGAVDAPNIVPAVIEKHLANCDEVLTLQAANADAQRYRAILTERLNKKRTNTETDVWLQQGADLYAQKKYAEAVAIFDKVIVLQPTLSEAWRQRGMGKRELKDYPGAMADFTKAIALDPQSHRAFSGRGLAKERNGDVRGALDDYSRTIQLKPDYENAWFNRAYLKGAQKDHAGAIADYDQLIILNPKQLDAINNRGFSKEALNDLSGAIRDYERALELKPDYETARKNLERVKTKLAAGTGDLAGGKAVSNEGKTNAPAAARIAAILENQSQESLHILVEGESFQPTNRLAPGEKRTVAVKVPVNGRIKFIAGRNGQVLTTKVWDGDPAQLNRYPRVIFDRQGTLVIMTGLR